MPEIELDQDLITDFGYTDAVYVPFVTRSKDRKPLPYTRIQKFLRWLGVDIEPKYGYSLEIETKLIREVELNYIETSQDLKVGDKLSISGMKYYVSSKSVNVSLPTPGREYTTRITYGVQKV